MCVLQFIRLVTSCDVNKGSACTICFSFDWQWFICLCRQISSVLHSCGLVTGNRWLFCF